MLLEKELLNVSGIMSYGQIIVRLLLDTQFVHVSDSIFAPDMRSSLLTDLMLKHFQYGHAV